MKKSASILVLLAVIFICRGVLFNTFFCYKIVGERKLVKIENQELKGFLNDNGDIEMKNLIKTVLSKTSEKLEFTFDKSEVNPNILNDSHKANCIGYSSFFASSLKEILKNKKIDKDWEITHRIGNIYFLNENVHPYFSSKFFKDHDFVLVKNLKTNEMYAVDATLYDYFGIETIKLKQD